jgi:hypothetical protein
MGVSVAGAGPLQDVRVWAEAASDKGAKFLSGYGITNASEQAAIIADWDEDTVVDVALKNRAFDLISWILNEKKAKLSALNMERVKATLLAEKVAPVSVVDIALKFPVSERGPFKTAAASVMAKRYPAQPEYVRMYVKYNLLKGVPILSPDVTTDDLVAFLLAPEPLGLTETETGKRMIKARMIEPARATLRVEGKSFVVKDGVNPLVAKVQPVVDALNAPACEGLEAALRALGLDVCDHDRADLKKVGDTWRVQVMRGDISGNDAARLLGKISIVLGADGYNRFVDEYNNGKAGGK